MLEKLTYVDLDVVGDAAQDVVVGAGLLEDRAGYVLVDRPMGD